MLALVLALGASLCFGVSDFVGGLQARRRHVLVVLLVSQAASLAGLVVVLAARGQVPADPVRLLPAVAAGLAGVVGLTAFYRALAIGTMSIVAPISATGVAIPIIAGIAGGERPAAIQLVGILAASAGVVLASREADDEDEHRARAARTSVVLALVAAVGFGLFAVGVRSSARSDVLWTLFSERAAGVAAVGIALTVLRRAGRPGLAFGPARTMGPVVLVGVLDLVGVGLYALAGTHGLLSIVAVAASLYPLVTVLLARTVLGERVQRIQEVGIATAVVGVALIAGG